MGANRHFYAEHFETEELKRKLRDAEDRSTRADTMEAALSDAYIIQEIAAAIEMKDKK